MSDRTVPDAEAVLTRFLDLTPDDELLSGNPTDDAKALRVDAMRRAIADAIQASGTLEAAEETSELALMKLALELIWRIHLSKLNHLGPERQSGIEQNCVPCICALMLGRGFGRQPTEHELRERLASFGDHHG